LEKVVLVVAMPWLVWAIEGGKDNPENKRKRSSILFIVRLKFALNVAIF
jgi:hypothetical protein